MNDVVSIHSAVRRHPEMRQVERQHDEAENGVDEVREVAGRDVVRDDRHRAAVVSPQPGGASLRRRRRHWAPLPKRMTFTVSKTIVRSKTSDRCLT